MNYEEKYKQALERARELSKTVTGANYEYIFPELQEDNDERIRKTLIELVRCNERSGYFLLNNIETSSMIAWLEKQGEKDPCIGCTNDKGCVTCENGNLKEIKIEPKFKAGDYIVPYNITSLKIWKIINIDEDGYYSIQPITNHENDEIYRVPAFFLERDYRLWTIQDAKEGDLIYVSTEVKGIQAIFHKFENGIIHFHCNFCVDFTQGGYEPSGDVEFVSPLPKIQYQRFFQKMKEAGYEWDAEKKELKKMEVASKENEDERMKKAIMHVLYENYTDAAVIEGVEIAEIVAWLEEQGERNQVSKTDEQSKNPCSGCTNIKGCITCVNGDQRQTSTPKILYSDEVIQWLQGHGDEFKHPDKVIFGFIKHFEL